MSFLSKLFGPRGDDSPSGAELRKRLERIEAEAERAEPAFVGTSFNRAGDLALKAGELDQATVYFGRAIDAFLEDGQREPARGVANKIIRVRPKAVRTLCTLTWLDLASKHTATALLHLRDYVDAAKSADASGLAADQLHAMAKVVRDAEFLGAVADALDGLDYAQRATEVREWARAGGSPDAPTDPEELASACLLAAMRSNERTRSASGRSGDKNPAR